MVATALVSTTLQAAAATSLRGCKKNKKSSAAPQASARDVTTLSAVQYSQADVGGGEGGLQAVPRKHRETARRAKEKPSASQPTALPFHNLTSLSTSRASWYSM